MSITGLDAATLARSLRRMAGDGSVEWVMEPIQSSVLRDIADMLDENKKLRKLALGLKWCSENYGCKDACPLYDKSEPEHCREERLWRELGIEVGR